MAWACCLDKSEAKLDWAQDAGALARTVRAFNPWPIAEATLAGERVRIHGAVALDEAHGQAPGTVLAASRDGIDIACGQGVLRLRVLQREGGKAITAADYLNARRDLRAAPGAATRMLAARVLAQVFTRGRSLKAELAWALPKLADSRDRALLEALCFAVLRRRSTYDAALQGWMQKPLSARDADLRTLLMVGFAQLDVLELPAHAALSATVDAARALGRERQAGLVNAILRRAQREGFPEQPARDAFPEWLAEAIERDWPAQAEAVFNESLQPAPLWLRANRQHGGRDKALAALAEAGIAAEPSALSPDALRLAAPVAVNQLPGFADGALSVQDLSAQCAADALAPAAGSRVLDACAAPGGKSAHLLERDPSLRLLALDIDARRLARARDTYAPIPVPGGMACRSTRACWMHRVRPPA
ncbi:hypothetical protein G6F31_013489 [Rhizopus arrhizus]|nr:hypothetical protein G6F31_013489 [Rhizopus arrhizus]